MDPKNRKVVILVIVGILVLMGILIALVLGGLFAAGDKINTDDTNTNQSSAINTASNSNTNEAANTNSTSQTSDIEIVLEGRVFTQGYNTPSESFGILATDGREIGLGSYDTMREQIRPYIGDSISVTFSNICKSSIDGCCRTLFSLCGTVKSWEPLTTQ